MKLAQPIARFARGPSGDESEHSLSPPLLGFPSLEPEPSPLLLALALDDDALEQPVFPRPPIAPRMDAVSLGLPRGTPLPVEEEIRERRSPTIRAERDFQPQPKRGEGPWLWALAGFAGGLVSLWLAGTF